MNSSIPKDFKFPKSLFVYMILAFSLPSLLLGPVALFTGAVTKAEYLWTISEPIIDLYFIFQLLCGIFAYLLFKRTIYTYDGTEESAQKLSKAIKLIEIFMILIPIILFAIEPFIISARCNAHNFTYVAFEGASPTFTWFAMLVGLTCTCSILMVVFFIQTVEHALYWVPYKKEYHALTLMQRITLITFIGIFGIVFLIESVFSVRTNLKQDLTFLLLWKVMPVSLLSGIMVVIDIFMNVRDINKNINLIESFTSNLSEKNYQVEPLPVLCRYELGNLILNVNSFYATTKDLLSGFNKNIAASITNAETLANNMEKASSSSTAINTNINLVHNEMTNQSAGVEEATASVQQIIGRIRELNTSIESQAAAVNESSAAVDEMVANINSVTQILEKNSTAVNSLGQASDEGRKTVESAVETADNIMNQSQGLLEASQVIQNIADQTNLLAMNAAIEAAHAGEAGKGFSVVADEIRKLAEQSNQQGKAIDASLKTLSAAISQVSTSTKQVQQKFDSIYQLAQTVKNQETVIMNAMAEQSSGNQQVLDAMKDINDSTATVKNGSAEMLSGGEQAVKEMNILSDATRKINERMNEMTESVTQITSAMTAVNDSSAKNQKDINILGNQMSEFKL